MPAEIFRWDEFANNGRGLIARPILPNNVAAVADDIASISYKSIRLDTNANIAAGNLVVADVMFSAAQPWERDEGGYTFLWPAPGEILWPLPNKQYRIPVTFVIKNPHPIYPVLSGKGFILVWQVNTKNPEGA
jgi:hypothetical protein